MFLVSPPIPLGEATSILERANTHNPGEPMQNEYVDKILGKHDMKDAPAEEALMPKHGFRDTHVQHHKDNSHTVRHTPHSGEEVSYAVKDDADLIKKLKQYLGKGSSKTEETVAPSDSPAEEKSEGEKAY
jgi:hypothetical protein